MLKSSLSKKNYLLFFGLKGQKSIAFAKKREKNVAKITALTQSNGSSFSYNSAVQWRLVMILGTIE